MKGRRGHKLKIDRLSKTEKARLVIRRISYQFPSDAASKLLFAVVEQAIRDLVGKKTDRLDLISAKPYLKGKMPHAEVSGVRSDWIRQVISRVGLRID